MPFFNLSKKVFSILVDINNANNDKQTDISPNRIISLLLLDVSIKVHSANGSVLFSPGIFPTKAIVAPNSPMDLAKDKTNPANIPGYSKGSVIDKNIFN